MRLLATIKNDGYSKIYVIDDGSKQVQVNYNGTYYRYLDITVYHDLDVSCGNPQHLASIVYAVELVRFIISEIKKDK